MKRVLKWVVPMDDQRHKIGCGHIVHIDWAHGTDFLLVWTEEDFSLTVPETRDAQVYNTGRTYPDNGTAVGSAFYPHREFRDEIKHLVTFYDGPAGYIKR